MEPLYNPRALALRLGAIDFSKLVAALEAAGPIHAALKARGLEGLPADAPAPIAVGELRTLIDLQHLLAEQVRAYDAIIEEHVPHEAPALPETPPGCLIA